MDQACDGSSRCEVCCGEQYDGTHELYSIWAYIFHDPSCHMRTSVLSEAWGLIKFHIAVYGICDPGVTMF